MRLKIWSYGRGQTKTRATPFNVRSVGMLYRSDHQVFLLNSRLFHHHFVTMHAMDLACDIVEMDKPLVNAWLPGYSNRTSPDFMD
jgi:hypothetical protein